MPILPIPVDRYLVPAQLPPLPQTFARVRQSLPGGLPVNVPLDAELSATLYVPVGDALLWRNAEGAASVASAADDNEPCDPTIAEDPLARATPRLVLRRAGQNVAVTPLIAGLRRRLPDDGGLVGGLIEIWVRDFQINAGTLSQAGDFGSFVDFGWRRIDAGSDEFSLPPLDPRVAERFAGTIQSEVGDPAALEGR
jgi:hypothetical protein